MKDIQLKECEQRFVDMVVRRLVKAREEKLNGELNFRALVRDGGLMDKYVTETARER